LQGRDQGELAMITLDDLYEEMQEAMRYLGVRWGDKHLVKTRIENNQLVLSHWGKTISIDINHSKQ
jgi:hypothetical protein